VKIGVLGDLHITNRSPARRKDSYFETILGKLKQAFDIFTQEDCLYVIQVGDFFDTPTVANRVIAEVTRLLLSYPQRLLCVSGQHDLSGHNLGTLSNSPLAVLESANALQILGEFVVNTKKDQSAPVYFYGASFGEDVPLVENPKAVNILVTHRMIGNRPLFPGQELENPRAFLRANPDYSLILCGDYHYSFYDEYQGRKILNPGCIVRKNLNDVREGLQPKVCVVSIPDLTIQDFPLDCKPVEEVFDLTKIEDSSPNKQSLEQFINRLKDSEAAKVGWKSMLSDVLQEKNVSTTVQEIINDILLECDTQ